MKVFLSGLESSEKTIVDTMIANGEKVDYILTSYYYIRKKSGLLDKFKMIANEILVDSGAHSFQKGAKVDWLTYTQEYASWIRQNDCQQILGFFEMDVDNIIGYERVLELRKILESASRKIIPVWHKNRGVDEFKKMCRQYDFASITGFKNEDIQDHQYLMFLKYANKHNCKIHCLGMTRIQMMNKVPFYSVDSSTWKQAGNFGEFREFARGKLIIHKRKGQFKTQELDAMNFKEFVKLQRYFKGKHGEIK